MWCARLNFANCRDVSDFHVSSARLSATARARGVLGRRGGVSPLGLQLALGRSDKIMIQTQSAGHYVGRSNEGTVGL